ATALIAAAECEALNRGCSNVLLDTFSFQALGFYKKLGYTEFGCLSGFAGGHERRYLHKSLAKEAANKRVSRRAKTHALTRRQLRTRSEFNVKRKDSYQKEIRLAISAPTIVRND
ncbi:MAG TPA: hypothetical protein VJS64_12080, partial [Pyrinomonadaceae bacterium]|nr:hypothetical protein [Pyrinomonadaceae bacterium]